MKTMNTLIKKSSFLFMVSQNLPLMKDLTNPIYGETAVVDWFLNLLHVIQNVGN